MRVRHEVRVSHPLLPEARAGGIGSETAYDMGLLGADSAGYFRTYVPYSWKRVIGGPGGKHRSTAFLVKMVVFVELTVLHSLLLMVHAAGSAILKPCSQ